MRFHRSHKTLDQEDFKFIKVRHKRTESELKAPNGNFIGSTTGKKKANPIFVNEEVEEELVSFKQEIESKFKVSSMNKSYSFPLRNTQTPVHSRAHVPELSVTPVKGFVSHKRHIS